LNEIWTMFVAHIDRAANEDADSMTHPQEF